jgi:hypothetical protein
LRYEWGQTGMTFANIWTRVLNLTQINIVSAELCDLFCFEIFLGKSGQLTLQLFISFLRQNVKKRECSALINNAALPDLRGKKSCKEQQSLGFVSSRLPHAYITPILNFLCDCTIFEGMSRAH